MIRRSSIRKISDRQKIKNREWSRVKKAMLKAQEEENFSFASCEACGKGVPIEQASVLEGHHQIFRSHQGPNTQENARILCATCHRGPDGIHK